MEDFEKIIDYYLDVEFNAKAKNALSIAMNQFPNDLSLTLIKVDFLNAEQKFEESFSCLEKIDEFYPNNVEVILNLGKLCSVTDQVPRAISYLEKAHNLILLDSSISELLSDVAYEYLQLGQNTKAIEVMKKILELDPFQ